MKEKALSLITFFTLIVSACGRTSATMPTQPALTATAISTATEIPTAVLTAVPTESPVELVWSLTGDPNPFNNPDGIAVDSQGNLYVMDSGNTRIQKFDIDGHFILMWGSKGNNDGQFNCSLYLFCMLAVDGLGNVYVTDNKNSRIQKFDGSGKFLMKWGSFGSEDGQFNIPFGIAVDREGNVYVGDVGNARIQKFDANGKFLMKWGSSGYDDGQFSEDLADIAVDSNGNVYVTDRSNGIYKFNKNGKYLTRLTACGDENVVVSATGVAVDLEDNVYFYDLSYNRMCKYDSNGQFLNNWNASGSTEGAFTAVGGVAVDEHGNVYVAELFDGRVRKFSQR